MGLDYIERDFNKLADALAKEGSSMSLIGDKNVKIVFRLEKLLANVQFK